MSNIDRFYKSIKERKMAKGVFITMSDMSVSEMAGYAGYDYVWIDAEHAPLDRQEIFRHILAAQSSGACAFVRVPGVDPYYIKAILDMGPDGIIFPFINNRQLAELAVQACAYPSRGIRGQGPIRAIRYGLEDEGGYIDGAYARVLKVAQIESLEGYENLDGIMSIPGIDSIFIGAADLSRSINDASPAGKEKLKEIYDDICRRVREKGMLLGAATGTEPEQIRSCSDKGIRWIVFGQDARIVSYGLKANLNAVNRALEEASGER